MYRPIFTVNPGALYNYFSLQHFIQRNTSVVLSIGCNSIDFDIGHIWLECHRDSLPLKPFSRLKGSSDS